MTRLTGNKLRLKPSILTAFIFLTVPVFFAIVAITYVSNDNIARANALVLVERFKIEAINNIQRDFDPLKSMIRSSAEIGNQQQEFFSDNRALKYFDSVLQHDKSIVSVYAGLEDGSFRQARRVQPDFKFHDKTPPEGAQYAYRNIVPTKKSGTMEHYAFLSADRQEIGTSDKETAYDPRKRPWYVSTAQSGALTMTDPEVFAAGGLIGFTIAAPFYAKGKLLGVAAADMTLDGLSEYLASRKISAGTVSYLLDQRGGVIANSDKAKTYINEKGRVELQHITSLQNELPATAFSLRPRNNENMFFFESGGKEYVGSITSLPAEFGKRWQLFNITPIDDFTGGFQQNNKRLFVFGLIAIFLQILIIYYLSGIIATPLEKLARKVDRIQELDTETLPSLGSPISEISVLSKAIDTLDSAMKSFASFVPIGLVKQLLESEQKLELGGHSRFLTIFFSDLESFSTLSEECPAQELLLRVSAYLEVVTKAVNQEFGTIDKFIGDGVMAFWGAPTLLEDHAWRSCVAALRIQHEMKRLNSDWEAQGLKPLNVRVGIHSDAVLVGNIGSRERMAYTALGDGVNVAARLEGINKEYGTRVCISHSTYKEAGERLSVRPIDDVAVKGRRSKIKIYEVMGAFGAGPEFEPTAEVLKLNAMTKDAYDAISKDEDNVKALALYRKILAEFPHDPVALEFVKRLDT